MTSLLYEALSLVVSLVAVAFVLTLHEFAHAFVAYKCGDGTPKLYGRLTLDPMAHFDPLGIILFAFAGFGWAKPVPIDPHNFRHYRRGLAMTALAGVTVNYICALLFYPLYVLGASVDTSIPFLDHIIGELPRLLYLYSISFCVFNLIPLAPLDGWRVVDAAARKRGKVFRFFEKNGPVILIVLIAVHFCISLLTSFGGNAAAVEIIRCFDILGYVLSLARYVFGWPIAALWGLVCGWGVPSIPWGAIF